MVNRTEHRSIDTDIMRLIAAFFVIMIHVSASHSYSLNSIIFNSISRFSVPVFVMISGRYMLANKPDIRKLASKCCRLFIIMIVWAGVYYLYYSITGATKYSGIQALAVYLLTEPTHFWYIYATIALYIFTPCFYIFCSNASKKDMLYALGVTFFFGSLVTLMLMTSHFALIKTIIDKMKLDCTLGFVFCYLLGYYLQRFGCQKKGRIAIYLLGVFGIAATIIGTLLLSGDGTTANYLLFSFFAPNVLVTSVAFYIVITQFTAKHNPANIKVRSVIHHLASYTLGIYLLHLLIFKIVFERFAALSTITIPGEALCVFILSVLCIFVLKKIPFIKKLV